MLKPLNLKNGLTVLRIPKTGSNIFLAGFVSNTGSAFEEGFFPQGISRFIERLYWCGTDKHPSVRRLNQTLEQIGGNFSSMTSQEFMQFYLSVPSYNQYKAVSMLAEIIQTSYFDEQDIKREQKIILENLREFSDQLEMDYESLISSNLYQNSSFGLPIQGTSDTINSITQFDILEYIYRQIRPDRSYLVLAGNFDSKPIFELVEQEWGNWRPNNKKSIELMDFQHEDVGELPRIIYRQRGIASTMLSLGFLLDEGAKPQAVLDFEKSKQLEAEERDQSVHEKLNNKAKPEIPNLDFNEITEKNLEKLAEELVLNAILGQGLSSRLWVKGVEEEMLFSSIQSKIIKYSTTGFLYIFGSIENTQFTFGLQSILSVLESLKKTTISINELEKAKEFVKGKMIQDQENLLESTIWQVENLLSSGLIFKLDELLAKIEKVEAANIRYLADQIFRNDRLAISTLGTAKETRLVDKLLKKYLD